MSLGIISSLLCTGYWCSIFSMFSNLSNIKYDPRFYALENYLSRGYNRINKRMRAGEGNKECMDLKHLIEEYGTFHKAIHGFRAVDMNESVIRIQKGFFSMSQSRSASIMCRPNVDIVSVEAIDSVSLFIPDVFPERNME